jgi:hypothetical protein
MDLQDRRERANEGNASIDRSDSAIRVGSLYEPAANTFGNIEPVAFDVFELTDPNSTKGFDYPHSPGRVRRCRHDVGERRDRLGSRRSRM